ncbi:helix-turn-helix domain-containing protein [Vitiosangium sp. GDMCC 1.1324]|uniref:winged helix-turn-helix transcriptional regulator n=1 Tax=Vitiosangium sp. (strain GDMCC 1.1324) TaxID=2138576 RepID=UPI000D3DC0AE|nr:helix-turn-helix domain-containing protein [Vitiosangium sp. GDMCC 1.1324]PTL77035.1 MarR family transcriptional regulator [Vitiosangium sp. GDMCC 1.1324]
MENDPPSYCGHYEKAIGLLGKRWTGLILHILLEGPRRFSELSVQLGAISERILSERLKELESEGIVERHVDSGPPVRVEYRLTDKGQALWKVVDEIRRWARRWVDVKPATRKRNSA